MYWWQFKLLYHGVCRMTAVSVPCAGEHKVGKKREAKNERYGFGGRKRLGKQNDATSAADTDSYKQGRFDDGLGRRSVTNCAVSP